MLFQPERQNHPYILHDKYSYVDVKQKDETFLRYQLDKNHKEDYKMISVPIKTPSRYAVTFDNPIVPEEREHWIAHTRATVIDLQDNTVMATKDWYSFESQQGYGRYTMWVTAATCPDPAGHQPLILSVSLLEMYLNPNQENSNEQIYYAEK